MKKFEMRRRRWLTAVAVVLAAVLLLVATLPWWLGPAVRAFGPHWGLRYATYQTLGYQRFAMTGVEFRRAAVTVKVSRVEADTPLLWAWRHSSGYPTAVRAGDWSVEVVKHAPTAPGRPGGWVPLRARLRHIAGLLDRWLPTAEVGKGVVRWPTGELSLESAQWGQRTLAATGLRFRALVGDAKATFPSAEDSIHLSATIPAQDATASLESRGSSITGQLSWWKQPATVDARFAGEGWIPAEATIDLRDLNVPGERLKLGRAYAVVTGHARAEWRSDHFLADVTLHSDPVAGQPAPPLDVTFRGRGDPHVFTVEALHAALPGGVADLTAPVTVDRTGRIRETDARFTVRLDLGQLPWRGAQGRVTGEARVAAAGARIPGVAFQLGAEGLTVQNAAVRGVAVTGRLDWPVVRIEQATVRGAGGDEMRAAGGWDFRQKAVIEASLQGDLRGATLGRWLPAAFTFDHVAVDARATGPVASMAHSGRAEFTGLHVAKLNAANAMVSWSGQGPAVPSFTAETTMGGARLTAEGSLDRSEVRLTHLEYFDHGSPALRLTEPARIAWRPTLAIDALHLKGANASVDAALTWGAAGKVELAVHGLPSAWVANFVPLRGPAWTLSSLALTGTWDHAPMTYSVAGGLTFALPQDRTGAINVAAHGTPAAMWIDALHAVESGNAVVNAAGRLPLSVAPARQPMVALDADGSLAFDVTTVPNAAFWRQLAAMTGVELVTPELSAHLTGSWAQPQGRIVFRAERAAMDPKRFTRPMPSIEAVDVALTGDADGLRLERFGFTIERQQVRATGRLPLTRNAWSELAHNPVAYLQRGAQLRIEVPDAEVAMFSRFLPAALAPAGRLQADLQFDRGALGGYLRLRDAASRPLGPLGVLQQVSADVEFTDHQVTLRRVSATSGGQPVTLEGTVGLPTSGWAAGNLAEPRYDVALHGKNIPFVRQSGLLVRGDLDLKLHSPDEGPPAISGKVVLRDSLFLTDVRAYLPHGSTASPSRRPPYFSVETKPLNTWVLDVDVTGTRFLRIRMPVFSGVASARFHLGGTLGEPRAIGDATVDEGSVRMPFASFEVKQAAVRLTEESPFEPTIYLRGTGRHYGYDLAMEVSGKASAPTITFTSSPALDSEQVLLMVMTGAAPSNEVNSSLTHRAVQIGAFFGQSLFGSLMGSGADPDRLSVESGEKISEQGKETYSIEYKLTDRLSLTGEYDEFDEYNAGIKWRVAPKPRK
jgi:translocation and assembly module TamB